MSWILAALKLGKHVKETKHNCSHNHIQFIIKIIFDCSPPKKYHYMSKLFPKKGEFQRGNGRIMSSKELCCFQKRYIKIRLTLPNTSLDNQAKLCELHDKLFLASLQFDHPQV